MRRLSTSLYVTYGALFCWLAHCAVQSALNAAPWAAAVFVVGSGTTIVAFIREGALEDALRREAVRAERAARPQLEDTSDAVVDIALAAACCERWWTSAGAEHDPSHCTRKDQTT